MKRNKLILFPLIISLISCSTGKEGHTHSFSDNWKYNKTYHWHECVSPNCYVQSDKGNHDLKSTENDGHYYSTCFCGYQIHRHVSSNAWSSDETYHYKECLDVSCNEQMSKANHIIKHVEEDENEYDICEVCGKKMNERETINFEFDDIKEEYQLVEDFPYFYLTALFDNRTKFLQRMDEASKPITISWGLDEGVTSLKLYYGLRKDFTDAKVVELDINTKSYSFINLFKASTYFIKLEETVNNETKTITSSFKTDSLGPRPLIVDGIKNVRDIGGYDINGQMTSQGLIYRGGQLTPDVNFYDYSLSEKGKVTMSQDLKIKTEIDLRTPEESKTPSLVSAIPNCNLVFETINGYQINNFKSKYKEIFTILSKPSSYPIYYHCTGGADRTGTLSYMINAFLGVNELDLIHDYEFTSFSPYDVRCTTNGVYSGDDYWKNFMKELNGYSGNTIQEKATNYLLSTGLTQNQLNNIKLIMTGHIDEVIE